MEGERRPTRRITVLLLLACLVIGAYGTMVIGTQDGLFDHLSSFALSPDNPAFRRYTGVAPVDALLANLVTFFGLILDTPPSQNVNVWLSYWYLMCQLCAGWSLLSVEGLRTGNRGSVVSWTAVLGVAVQTMSLTVAVPLYLIAYVCTSPIARRYVRRGSAGWEHVSPSINLWGVRDVGDLERLGELVGIDSGNEKAADVLPGHITAAFVIPAILMALPFKGRYVWSAIWQAFPVWQGLLHFVSTPIGSDTRRRTEEVQGGPPAVAAARVYDFARMLCIPSHLCVLVLWLMPASVAQMLGLPGWAVQMVEEVNVWEALIPAPLWDPPTLDGGASMAELARFFLQWDVYAGSFAILIWATYLHGALPVAYTRSGRVLGNIMYDCAVGGPVNAAVMLLWDRDVAVETVKRKMVIPSSSLITWDASVRGSQSVHESTESRVTDHSTKRKKRGRRRR